MTTIYLALLSGALVLYTLSLVTGFFHLFQPRPQKTLWCKRFILAGSSLHLLAFFERCFQAQTLAVTNLLPLPALDGGRILFIIVEAIRGKRISPEKEGAIHFIGLALLLMLMAVISFYDVSDPIDVSGMFR